jgi:2-polyprenyl-3-methyl-5-hydroxy-6-metoxy-1,4-benzoquinol methylase
MQSKHADAPTSRAAAEGEFYNRYAEQLNAERLDPARVFAPTCLENVYLLEQFGDLAGKRVLDIGCGQGDTSVFFALRGAEVFAVDVSERMVGLTRELAEKHGVAERMRAEVCRVEDMKYPTDYFDMVFADGVLHHLDMPAAVPNIVRVMKPGGRGFFIEPQKGSIFIEIYRHFARDLRTADERPLEARDLEFLRSQFCRLEHREYHLVSLALFAARFVQLKLQAKAFPYWMDEVRQGKFYPRALGWLQKLDEQLLRTVPALRKWCWMTVICAEK